MEAREKNSKILGIFAIFLENGAFLSISGWLPMGINRNRCISIKTNKNQ
jgi:hypothetical protein